MKVALINDTHFGARGENPHINEFFHRFFENIFFPYIKEHNITTVVHLGDVVDRRKFVNFQIWSTWRTRFFDRLRAEGITVHMLTGNHDTYFRNTNDINALNELLGGYENIKIYRETCDVKFGDLTVTMVPWINSDNLERTLDYLKNTPSQVIFGHLEIAGFEMDRGNVCQTGLTRQIFDKFDMVLSGHFHHKSSDGTIYYLGNQVEITWADYGDRRGFHIFDTDTRELTFVENPYHLFYRLSYDDSIQNFEHWKHQDFTPYANSYVKVVVTRKQNPYLFDTVMDQLYKVTPIDVTIVEDYTEQSTGEQHELDQAEDTITIIQKCVDNMTLVPSVQPAALKQLLQELYVEALNTETAIQS
jgi:DNA repair exonuclease SbcCD nuclease subunit